MLSSSSISLCSPAAMPCQLLCNLNIDNDSRIGRSGSHNELDPGLDLVKTNCEECGVAPNGLGKSYALQLIHLSRTELIRN